jgi:transcriptional regulator with XRE-family HTH domain
MATNETEIKQGRYAAYIDSLITISPKSQATIAKEVGYKNANNLSLIKSGKIPLPVDKVRALAKALDADPVRLMLMVLEERHPELLEFFAKRELRLSPLMKNLF